MSESKSEMMKASPKASTSFAEMVKPVSFEGKGCIVTGGAEGIGRAIATAFALRKAKVVIADVNEEAAKDAVDEIRSLGGDVRFIVADVASEADVRRLIDESVEWCGNLAVLVNNAGIGGSGQPITETDVSEWDRVLAVNLRGPFLCAKYATPYLAMHGGSILNIASTRALMSEANTESYSASKGGVLALTHALAVSLGAKKIRVNAISPGWIETAAYRQRSERFEPHHTDRDREQHPVGRVGVPEDIARAALFLCSDAAGFITGTNLVIDGGMTIKMIYE